jgi:PAS domain S-box-containing protein
MPNLFSVPDKEKNYQGYMVYVLAVIWSVVTGLIVSMGFYFFPHIWQRWLILLFVAIFICLFHLVLNRLGYTRIASWSFTIMLWLFITIPCYTAGGIIAPGLLSQTSVILTAGFLLGWRGGILIGVLTILADFLLVYMELTGQLPAPSVIHTPLTRWIAAIIPFGTVLALQYYATNHLRSGLLAMQREIVKREDAEKIKDSTLHRLQERIKELKTLYSVNQILQNEDATYQQIVSEIAAVIPMGWQYPDITAARVRIADTEFVTKNYVTSQYSQHVEVKSALGTKAFIEVVYLKPMPAFDEGPFLNEERDLINMLAEMLKIDLDRRERTVELKDYKYALDVAAIVSISDVNGLFHFVNENFCKASKYKQEELFNKHHSIIWSDFHTPEYYDEIRVAMQNGTPFRGEFCNKAKDGTLYWVDSSIVPFVDKNGKVYQYLSISYDITKQKNAEHFIKEQSEMFKAIIENTKESIYLLSPDYKILQFNTTARERIEVTRGMQLYKGADFRTYLFPDTADRFYSMFNDSLNGVYRAEEFRSKGVNGIYFWFQSKTSPVYDLRGELIGVRVLTESIDEKKQAEAELRENEEKFRSIVEQSLVGIYIIQNGKLIYVNPGFEKIFGYSKDNLINQMSFDRLVHEEDVDMLQSSYDKPGNNEKAKEQYIFRGIRNDGALLYLEVISSLITYNHEPAIIGTLVDITDRIEEERRISKAVLDAQENERLQIGMELHDNVKQILAGSGLYLDMAATKINDKSAVSQILGELKKFNAEAIDELRRLSHQLAPLVEEDTKLKDKIEWLIRNLKLKESVTVSIQVEESEKPLDNTTQLAFYRILQEQLTNIIKYAKASLVDISIRTVNNDVYLQVKDNGIGFDVNEKKDGIGLANIQRRVQLLNGKVEIVSFPGKGCEINVQVQRQR